MLSRFIASRMSDGPLPEPVRSSRVAYWTYEGVTIQGESRGCSEALMIWQRGRIVLGIILAVIGIIWILQGANAFGASGGMNGQHQWIVIGAIVGLVGLALIASVNRRLRRR